MSSVSGTSSTDVLSTDTQSAAQVTASALSQLISSTNTSSGLDDNTIINELVSIEAQPITALQAEQTALQSQISAIAQISSALQALATAAQNLQSNGAVGLTAGSNTAFTASADAGAQAGTYQIQVTQLAQAAKDRSQGYSSTDTMQAGTLTIVSQGQTYTVAITDGMTLNQATQAIASTGAPVSASVISDGTDSYLSITNNASGIATGVASNQALAISFSSSSSSGVAPTFTQVTKAQNAALTVDDLPVTSQSNTVTGVIPDITLNLVSTDSAAETLNIQADVASTANNLQTFVSAYNSVIKLVEDQTNVQQGGTATDGTSQVLAGDPTLTDLQQRLQALFTSSVSEAGSVNVLPDIGLSTSETDGTLSLDTSQLSQALAQDPNSINALFGLSSDSIAQLATDISTDYTEFGTGALDVRTQGLNDEISDLSTEEDDLQAQLSTYQQNLIQQFSNMESVVASLKSTSSYLTSQDNAKSSS